MLALLVIGLSASCVSKKKFSDLQNRYEDQEGQLSQAKMELAACLEAKKNAQSEVKYPAQHQLPIDEKRGQYGYP